MVVQGVGFENNVKYKCVLNGIGMLQEQTMSNAWVISPTQISCSSPKSNISLMWGRQMQAAFSITANDDAVSYKGSNPALSYITYTVASWSAATPIQYYTSGGGLLTVVGSGFGISEWKFAAKFASGPYQATSDCTRETSSLLKCPIPGIRTPSNILVHVFLCLSYCIHEGFRHSFKII